MAIELVSMTILGCDDGGTNCRYIATVNQRWETVSLCDAVSEKRLLDYRDQPYPVVVAVCQTPDPKVVTDLAVKPLIKKDSDGSKETDTGAQVPAPVTALEEGLADRAISRVSEALPSAKGLKKYIPQACDTLREWLFVGCPPLQLIRAGDMGRS